MVLVAAFVDTRRLGSATKTDRWSRNVAGRYGDLVGNTGDTAGEDELWHYTDAGALASILQTNVLRATTSTMLNDTGEIKFGIKRLKEVWESHKGSVLHEAQQRIAVRETEDPSKISPIPDLDEFMTETFADLDEYLLGSPLYVLCASRDGDSLSQWRAYGGQQGYAIKLDNEGGGAQLRVIHDGEPAKSIPFGYDAPQWEAVIYHRDQQELTLKKTLVDLLAEFSGDFRRPVQRPIRRLFLARVVSRIKHDGFRDEQEMRYCIGHPELQKMFSLRPGRYGLTPYVDLASLRPGQVDWQEFERTAPKGDGVRYIDVTSQSMTTSMAKPAQKLPISMVRIGPTSYPESAEFGLRQALNRYGYEHVEIEPSKVPYR